MFVILFIAVLNINARHSGDKGCYVTGPVNVSMLGTYVALVVSMPN